MPIQQSYSMLGVASGYEHLLQNNNGLNHLSLLQAMGNFAILRAAKDSLETPMLFL